MYVSPAFCLDMHSLFDAALATEAERRRHLHLISLLLPKSHRDTMEVLLVFLKWVASFAHIDETTGSKMDLGNLATVICPSILYSRSRDAIRDESFGAIRVTTVLLENQDEFFTVPEEFLHILQDQEYFANSLELPGKEFLKKCDTYMKLKEGSGGHRRPPNMPPFNPAHNDSNPRFNAPNSPISERPPIGGPFNSAPRPHPGMPQPTGSFPPGSPMQTAGGIQSAPRTPQPEEWAATPRPNPNGAAPSSRPSSYIQPRPSHEHPN